MRRLVRIVLLFVLVVPAATRSIGAADDVRDVMNAWERGQKGGSEKAASSWSRPATASASPPRVDLRSFMPPVGNQKQCNSCTCWAVGYGLKTYQEAVENRWDPRKASHQFAAMYIYNQLNGGRDKGTAIDAALELLRRRGCAPMSVCRIGPTDYRRRPSTTAHRAAAPYRTAGYARLSTATQIRHALASGYPVVIGARLTPVFHHGDYDVYTQAYHKFGMQNRDPNMPHALHAMIVVGYDDSRRAFLVQNSWSPAWGDGGYCWVGYDTMSRAVPGRSTAFLREAFIGYDRQTRGSEREEPRAKIKVTAVRCSYIGTSPATGRPLWRWYARLTAPEDTLRRINRVRWEATGPDGRRHACVATRPERDFAAVGHFGKSGRHRVDCEIRFKSGSTANGYTSFLARAPKPKDTKLDVTFNNRYYGYNKRKKTYDWKVKISLFSHENVAELDEVRSVTYSVYDQGKRSTLRGTNRGENFAADYLFQCIRHPKDKYPVRGSVEDPDWDEIGRTAPFRIAATVRFRDGSTQRLQETRSAGSMFERIHRRMSLRTYHLPAVYSPAGRLIRGWKICVEGPGFKIDRVRSVTYESQGRRKTIDFNGKRGFPATIWVTRNHVARATIRYRDGKTETLQTQLTLSGWKSW